MVERVFQLLKVYNLNFMVEVLLASVVSFFEAARHRHVLRGISCLSSSNTFCWQIFYNRFCQCNQVLEKKIPVRKSGETERKTTFLFAVGWDFRSRKVIFLQTITVCFGVAMDEMRT
jgi:hypothetical protein